MAFRNEFYLSSTSGMAGVPLELLCPNHLPEKEQFLEFVDKTLSSFDRLLDRLAENQSPESFALNMHFLPRNFGYQSSDGPAVSFPPLLPFLEATLSFVSFAFKEYNEGDKGNQLGSQKAFFAKNICFAGCKLLSGIGAVTEGRLKLGLPTWEKTADNFNILSRSKYLRDEVFRAYFTPGRNRFGLSWSDYNPYAPVLNNSSVFPTCFEVRLDPKEGLRFGNQSNLTMDFSVRQWETHPYSKSSTAYSRRSSVELIDFIFGPGRHHLLLANGIYEECIRLVKRIMKELNLGDLFKTTAEIPFKTLSKAS